MCKIDILLTNKFHKLENKDSKALIYFRGHVFINNKVYENNSFLDNQIFMDTLLTFNTVFIKKLDGNFAFVIINNNRIALCVDRIRSIPLFFTYTKDKLYISDKVERINKRIKGKYNSVSFEEFKFTGFVTNENTLVKDIKQVEAGNYINFVISPDGIINRNNFKYFTYNPKPQNNQTKQNLLKNMSDVFLNTFQQLINFANGRKIIVPLSGGLDSRLIVYYLHKFNYKNVLCFSYGKPNNSEALISKKVSGRCYYDWKFVTYTRKMWRQLVRSDEGKDYYKFASNLTSLAHIQDYMAIKSLRNKRDIHSDSIIVPGHSLDFIAGSHTSLNLFDKELSKKTVLQAIIKKHFNLLFDTDKIYDSKFFNEIEKKIYYNIQAKYSSIDDMYSDYESWNYNERQAKYIVNSVRAYDYFSINWTLPFYYKDLLEFWKSVPYKMKFNRRIFKTFVKHKFLFEAVNQDDEQNTKSSSKASRSKKIKVYFDDKKEHLSVFFLEYFNHPFQWYGMFDNYYSYLKFSKSLFYKYVVLENRILKYYLDINLHDFLNR